MNDKKIMYKVYKSIWTTIQELTVLRLSEKSVWYVCNYDGVSTRRELLTTSDYTWFHTEEEAYKYKRNNLLLKRGFLEAQINDIEVCMEELSTKYKGSHRNLLLKDILTENILD